MDIKVMNRAANVFSGVLDRCYNENNHAYKNYGGRGIIVSDEWLSDPTKFFQWYLENHFDKCQIDRINVNGIYEESNCRMVTAKENSRNRRNTRMLTAFGETKSHGAWSEDPRAGEGVTDKTINGRLGNGWSPEDAIFEPKIAIVGQSRNAPKYTCFEETKSLYEWSIDKRCVVDKGTLWFRLDSGWNVEKAITKSATPRMIDGKSVSWWSQQPECEVKYDTLVRRLDKGMSLQDAMKKKV